MKQFIISSRNRNKNIETFKSASYRNKKNMSDGYDFAKEFASKHAYLINALREL